MSKPARMFPMQHGPSITWETAAVIYRAYSRFYGTRQTLERLAERGGFGWGEVDQLYVRLDREDKALLAELTSNDGGPSQ